LFPKLYFIGEISIMRRLPISVSIFTVLFFIFSLTGIASAQKGVGKGGVSDALATLQQEKTELRVLISGLQTQIGNIQLTPGPRGPGGADDQDGADISSADLARITELEILLNGVTRSEDTLMLTGMNLQVVSVEASALTDGPVNGLGNIIIGYNEPIAPTFTLPDGISDKTGSHNLMIGRGNNYSSYGGIISGQYNVSSATYALASGFGNIASSFFPALAGEGEIQQTAVGQASVGER
jgi:hypothetical protein